MISSTDIEVASTKSKCCSMPSVEVFDQRRPLLSRYDLNKVIMNYLVTGKNFAPPDSAFLICQYISAKMLQNNLAHFIIALAINANYHLK